MVVVVVIAVDIHTNSHFIWQQKSSDSFGSIGNNQKKCAKKMAAICALKKTPEILLNNIGVDSIVRRTHLRLSEWLGWLRGD